MILLQRFSLTCFVAWCVLQSACTVATPLDSTSTLTLKQGITQTLKDGLVTVTLTEVTDFTSAGCQGGPRGCSDMARIMVTNQKSTQELPLYLPHTEEQLKQGSNQAVIFGYRITLKSINKSEATFVIDKITP